MKELLPSNGNLKTTKGNKDLKRKRNELCNFTYTNNESESKIFCGAKVDGNDPSIDWYSCNLCKKRHCLECVDKMEAISIDLSGHGVVCNTCDFFECLSCLKIAKQDIFKCENYEECPDNAFICKNCASICNTCNIILCPGCTEDCVNCNNSFCLGDCFLTHKCEEKENILSSDEKSDLSNTDDDESEPAAYTDIDSEEVSEESNSDSDSDSKSHESDSNSEVSDSDLCDSESDVSDSGSKLE